MANNWVKSLHCKSKAYEDVYHPKPKPKSKPKPKPKPLLLPSAICSNTAQNLKDVIEYTNSKPKPKKPDPNLTHKRLLSSKSKPDPIPKPGNNYNNTHVRQSLSAPVTQDPVFPSVSELQPGHPSRNVVEIIFHSRWGPKGFPGRVEMVFKIQNVPRVTSQFEEFRNCVRTRAGPGSARCSADGNEMMRFRCLGPIPPYGGGTYGSDWTAGCGKGLICTFSGSGEAHESVGGGRGRRAMIVCRVIAGRVRKRAGLDGAAVELGMVDSVSEESGELVVFDNRAVLPCFLVIYKL